MSNKTLYFFIGTEAELMKMFKVIIEAKERGYECKIISNGQNDLNNSHFLQLVGGCVDIDLTNYGKKEKNAFGYAGWFIKTEKLGVEVLNSEMKGLDKKNVLMIVHGDTLSTLMGARIAKRAHINYVHVESGLRSYNLFSPFPEEIDRYWSSKNSKINFCPKKDYADYAEKAFKGKSVNTEYNTGIETLYYAIEQNSKTILPRPLEDKYFLVAIHRQENLMNEKYLKNTFRNIMDLSKEMNCLFIYHEQTKNALVKNNIWEEFSQCDNITILPRQDYFSFINCVENSEFVVADGCGNQQEFYYLGKPYLIMRTKVEKNSEGIGWNAKYFEGDYTNIGKFSQTYRDYIHEKIIPIKSPSKIVMNSIDEYFEGGI